MKTVEANPVNLTKLGIGIVHHFCGDAPGHKPYIKEARLPRGAFLGQHIHDHDHLSVLVSGSVLVVVDGIATRHDAKDGQAKVLLLKANSEHEIVAITDAVWLCIWATEDTDPATVDTSILKGN